MIKISTPIIIAWYLAEHVLPPQRRQIMVTVGLIAIPALLIAKQPDLGTSLLVTVSGAAVLFMSGIPWWFQIRCVALLAGLTPIFWHFMHDYQKARIMTLLNPEADPLGRGYHIIQSKIAIGSGGIYGKGWLNGTQTHLEFLPERSTDFIFAVFAEEFGLLGCLGLLAVYLLICCRSLYITVHAQDTFSRLLAGSLSITFFVYVFVNIGMVIGILPVVGVPLPLISYGGTSMVTLLAEFGILMSIHTHRRLLPI
jgi:rod shape determining protein RodA